MAHLSCKNWMEIMTGKGVDNSFRRESDLHDLLGDILSEFNKSPIDLLNIGDVDGESTYLINARRSYHRTVKDVLTLFQGKTGDDGARIKVLEIGAYLGVVSASLSRLGFAVTALDLPEFMQNEKLQKRYLRNNIEPLSANLRDYKIPADSEHYDLVIMCETLEHLNFNPIPVLLEISRVLRVGGILYLSLPNLVSLVNRVKLLSGNSIHNPVDDFFSQLSASDNMIVGLHWREYTSSEIRELLSRLGFALEKQYYFTSNQASLPARLVYRFIPSLQQNQTTIARKIYLPDPELAFCDAVTT